MKVVAFWKGLTETNTRFPPKSFFIGPDTAKMASRASFEAELLIKRILETNHAEKTIF